MDGGWRMEGEVTEEGTRAEIKRVVHHVQQERVDEQDASN